VSPEIPLNVAVGEPIPKEMPPHTQATVKQSHDIVAGIGEPTNACFFTNSNIDPQQWYVSTFPGKLFNFLLLLKVAV